MLVAGKIGFLREDCGSKSRSVGTDVTTISSDKALPKVFKRRNHGALKAY